MARDDRVTLDDSRALLTCSDGAVLTIHASSQPAALAIILPMDGYKYQLHGFNIAMAIPRANLRSRSL
jgi:hypothetical protein